MVRIYVGGICPKCKKGELRGTVRNAKKFLIRCTNSLCRQSYQVKARVVSDDEWEKESELPVLPPHAFMSVANTIVELARVFGSENLVGKNGINEFNNLPVYKMYWFSKDLQEMSGNKQLEAGIEPIRLITLVAMDPLWLKFGVAPEPPLIKLATDNEIQFLQKMFNTEITLKKNGDKEDAEES